MGITLLENLETYGNQKLKSFLVSQLSKTMERGYKIKAV